MSRDLAEYTSLVATARANDRSGNPVGVAYLSDASAIMQDTILPVAESLYSEQAEAVADTQVLHRPAARDRLPPSPSALLVALVLAQVYLARKSKRRVNPGLVRRLPARRHPPALAGRRQPGLHVGDEPARTEGAQPLGTVTQARILAQQARADETLALLQRGSDEQSEVDYARRSAELADDPRGAAGRRHGPATTPPIDDAVTALDGWRRAHRDAAGEARRGGLPGRGGHRDRPGGLGVARQFAAPRRVARRTPSTDSAREELDGMAGRLSLDCRCSQWVAWLSAFSAGSPSAGGSGPD